MSRRLTQDQFFDRARKLHGEVYDYSGIDWSVVHGVGTKIQICCPRHGTFQQSIIGHLQGSGCKPCSVERRSNARRGDLQTFIERARAAHGDRYDYSKVNYRGTKVPVKIVCAVHGEFEQSPQKHVSGQRCRKCAGYIDGDLFVAEARGVHGDRYDYSLVEYKDKTSHILIRCHEHGPFPQLPSMHLSRQGCPECAGNRPLTKQRFIERAVSKHGPMFDYSRIPDDPRTGENVEIGCPIHGFFTQNVKHHLDGRGCRKCGSSAAGRTRRMVSDAYICRATTIWAGKYDYSEVSLTEGLATESKITCKRHGPFYTKAIAHLRGRGCLACGDGKMRTSDDFAARAREIHGSRYDYSRVAYTDSKVPVEIVCESHGPFEQRPSQHLFGYGCAKCGVERRAAGTRLTLERFLERAQHVWGNRFDYGRVEEIKGSQAISIVCPVHGEFFQSPFTHLKGHDCPSCAYETRSMKMQGQNRITHSEFLERARRVHGNRYEYDDATYQGWHTRITITCREHGNFDQMAGVHLDGSGCPKCRASHGERAISSTLADLELDEVTQWIDHDLRVVRPLPFDHYVSGLRLLIEYDGQQHYEPIVFGGRDRVHAEKVFKGICRRDRLKTAWARRKGFHFVRVPFWIDDTAEYLVARIAEVAQSRDLVIDPAPGE